METWRYRAGISVAVVAALLGEARGQTPVGSAFTYQGQLNRTGQPVNGLVDFGFGLFDVPDGGGLIAEQVNLFNVEVVNGRFTVQLDFGPEAFDGAGRWLGILVRFPAGTGDGVLLSPRQPITPVPYALHALNGGGGAGDGHSLDAADGDPVDALVVDNNGRVGVGTTAPLARVHVRAGNLGLSSDAVSGDDLIVEGIDAVLGLYSENRGNAGSAIAFKELDQGLFTNTWGLFRDSSDNGAGLRFTFGNDTRYFANPTAMYLAANGRVGIGTTNPGNRLSVNGVIESMAGGFRFPDGTVQATAATGGGGNGVAAWTLRGNTATDPTVNFLGTRDLVALEIHVNGDRALRIEPGAIEPSRRRVPNIIGGTSTNSVGEDVWGATISGGGRKISPHQVLASLGTISGGSGNEASGYASTVGGGTGHIASGQQSTVGGGAANRATGAGSTVGGGARSTASGHRATVPGGADNVAGGEWSFAAGHRAKVRDAEQAGDQDGDEGTFVWADSINADFTSTGRNQFLIRAAGGVGINTNSPEEHLHVVGDVLVEGSIRANSIQANTKNFRVPYPDKPGTEIWYACVEGPEVAAYIRGTAKLVDGQAVITLPDHFKAVTNERGMTVQVTPLSADSRGLAVVRKSLEGVIVKELHGGSGSYDFDWEVKCVRKGYQGYQVVRPNVKVARREKARKP